MAPFSHKETADNDSAAATDPVPPDAATPEALLEALPEEASPEEALHEEALPEEELPEEALPEVKKKKSSKMKRLLNSAVRRKRNGNRMFSSLATEKTAAVAEGNKGHEDASGGKGHEDASEASSSRLQGQDRHGSSLLDDDDGVASQDASSASAAGLARLAASDARRWEVILDKIGAGGGTNGGGADAASYAATQSKVKYYARRGLPDGLRRRAWTILAGVDLVMGEKPGEYIALVERADEEYRRSHDLDSAADLSESCGDDFARAKSAGGSRSQHVMDTIELDIRRTFHNHRLFHDVGGGLRSSHAGSQHTGSGMRGSARRSTLDDETSYAESDADLACDEIAKAASLMGQDPTGLVQAKKQLFDKSVDAYNNARFGDVDDVPIPRINEGRESLEKDADSDQKSLDIFDDDKEDPDPGPRPEGWTGSPPPEPVPSWGGDGAPAGTGPGQDALRRVLRAYSVYDGEVGYCQGMNFIAAMFLTFLAEEEAFWLLVVVMNEEPYRLRELFGEDMARTHEVLYVAEKLLAQFLPKLSKHMDAEKVHVSMFVTQWLLTLYTSTFPFELVVRVWDSFLVEGWKMVYRVMLSLLECSSKDVMDLKFEEILRYFREFPAKVNGRAIIAGSNKIGLKRKHIQKHANEWRRHAGKAKMSSLDSLLVKAPSIRFRPSPVQDGGLSLSSI